jgi:hypothetical protein
MSLLYGITLLSVDGTVSSLTPAKKIPVAKTSGILSALTILYDFTKSNKDCPFTTYCKLMFENFG